MNLKSYTCFFLIVLLMSACINKNVKATSGKPYHRMNCYFFFIADCPACKSDFSKVMDLNKKYHSQGLTFTAVYSDPYPDSALVATTLKDYKFTIPWICDSTLTLAGKYEAIVTPQFVLLDSTDRVIYSGMLDDYYYSLGKHRSTVTQTYLEDAVTATLAGTPIPISKTEPIGCRINFNLVNQNNEE